MEKKERTAQVEKELIQCLVMLTQSWNLPIETNELRNIKATSSANLMKEVSHILQIRVKNIDLSIEELLTFQGPLLIQGKDGSYRVLGMKDERRIVTFLPGENPFVSNWEMFESFWSGKAWQIVPRITWRNLLIRYNVTWFTNVILHYKRFLYESLTASFFLQLFGLLTPLFTQVILDKVIPNHGIATLDMLALLLVFLYFFQALMGFLRTYLLTHTTNKFDVILGTRIFRQMLSLPLPYFENRRVGDTLMRIGALSTVRQFLTGTALTLTLDAFFSIVFILVLFSYSVSLSLIILALLPIFFLINYYATPIFKQRLEAVWEAANENNSFIVEAVSGMHTVKSLALEPQFNQKWEQLLGKYVTRTFDSAVFNIGIGGATQAVQMISGFTVLWFGGNMVMRGEMTLGQLIAFQMLTAQVVTPMMHLVTSWQSFQQAGLSMERLGDIINTRPEPVLMPMRNQGKPLQGQIDLEQVSFRYRPDHEPVLRDITVSIAPGQRIGIVGRSGSGKSTFTKLIQKMYLPEAGSIRIDGVSLQEVEPQWLRPQIGVVMQENYLFNGTVRENIALSNPSAPMEAVIVAAQMAGAHEFILELSEGYDTKVGEKGASLSGGQRQRIAIARALLTNPRILIFDEATSALDYESETIIMEHLEQICAGRTMMMIAHRLSTVRACDCILVIDKGRLVEQGSHEELVEKKGLYYHLYQQQEGSI